MTDNGLREQAHNTAPGGAVQEASKSLQTGPLDGPTYAEIVRAFGHLGPMAPSLAAAQRLILLAYARSKKVRRAVSNALPTLTGVTDEQHGEDSAA